MGEGLRTERRGSREGSKGLVRRTSSTVVAQALAALLATPQRWRMTIGIGYLLALGDARSCLAALADATDDDVATSHFEQLLVALDILEAEGPATWPVTADPDALLARLATAVDRLVELGADPLPLAQIVTLAYEPPRSI